jgi:copper chaperone CopZ
MSRYFILAIMLCAVFAGPAFSANPVKVPLAKTAVAEKGIIHIGVNGMVCEFCAQSLKKTFRKEPGVKDVTISLEKKMVTVQMSRGKTISDAIIRKRVSYAGYEVESIHRM